MTHVLRLADPFGRGPGPSPSDFDDLGAFLLAVREHKGLSIAQVADATRVRAVYLVAIERGELAPLPSRPFAVGYVRAYARTLGLDGDAAVARFKAEHPESAPALRAPVGVSAHSDPRRRVLYAGLGVVAMAVILWNVAQRTLTSDQASGPEFATEAQAQASPFPKGPLQIGAPTPPPADQTTPQPYATPGLGMPDVDPNAPASTAPGSKPVAAPTPSPATSAAVAPVAAPPPSPALFTTRAAVFGSPTQAGGVITVQAKKPASLIVRGPAGTIYFARQLDVGEAYRAPLGRGLTADVSDPAAFDVYVQGRLQGALTDPQTPLDKLASAPAASAPAAEAGAARASRR